jgi:hypothetical protein
MGNASKRRAHKKAMRLRRTHRFQASAIEQALGPYMCVWRREAQRLADSLCEASQGRLTVWQLMHRKALFIKALHLPASLETLALEELEELFRSAFSRIMPHCPQQFSSARRLSVRRVKEAERARCD